MNTSVASANQPGSKLIKWVNRFLVVAVAYAIASLTIQFIPEVSGNKSRNLITGNASQNSSATVASSRTQLGAQVVSSHLFGIAGSKPQEETKTVAADAPETKLNLALAGVFAYTPQDLAIAIISSGGREENVYGIGDKIVGSATLKAVFPDRVIIENRGREETLKLPEDVAPIALPRVSSTPVASGSRSGGGIVDLPSTPKELRDKLVKNPSMLGKIVSATPYQENGKLVGFRLQPKQNPEILEAQGIMANDIITQVNGISLNSQKQGIRALRKLVKADNIELTILRDGIEVPVAISLSQ